MSDSQLRTVLGTLERKLILLLGKHERLKAENKALRDELDQTHALLGQREQQLGMFQNKDKISKIVSGMVENEVEPNKLGDMLDEYIQEVDKCIAKLSE